MNKPRSCIRVLKLPSDLVVLEEANLPPDLAQRLAGQTMRVEVVAEEIERTRYVEDDDFPYLVDPQGHRWNAYRPVRVTYAAKDGRVWRLPRKWLDQFGDSPEPDIESSFKYREETEFTEWLCLPTFWDLAEINIPMSDAIMFDREFVAVRIRVPPSRLPRLTWTDPKGATWRIPHNWRRRRIVLPRSQVLEGEGVPADVAEEFGQKIVSVNYHPGSLCCLADQYRFRDGSGGKWPIYIKDCVLVGYGDEEERRI